jgi:tetratricopeptide (TPR) repeat protein
MTIAIRPCLSLLLLWTLTTATAWGQNPLDAELAPPLPQRPRTPQELNHLEAQKLYGLGLLRERHNQFLDAIQAFEQAVKLDPEAALPHKALIPLYFALDRNDDAFRECRKAVEQNPSDYETWYLYARQLKAQGQLKEALTAMARAAACPEAKEVPEVFAQIAFDLARMYEDARDYPRALATFEEVLKIPPEEDADTWAAEIYQRIAQVCTKMGQLDRAVQALRKTQELLQTADPIGSRRLDYAIAKLYWDQGKAAEALTALDHFLLTEPPGTEPYELKIRILDKLGRSGEIIKALQDASSRDRHNVPLKLLLARQYVRGGQLRRAEGVYTDLLAESPTPEVYQGFFNLYRQQRRMPDVLNLLDQTVAAATDSTSGSSNPSAKIKARAMIGALRNDPELAGALIPAARIRLQARQPLEHDTRQFLALIATRTHQLDMAETLYRSLLDAGLNSRNEALVYDGLLQVLWEADNFDQVAAVCRRGLRETHFTNRLLFHQYFSRALMLMGKPDEALAEADQAVQLSDERNRLHFRLLRATILKLADRYERAEAECLELLRDAKEPKEIRDIRYELSGVYSAAHAPEKAEEQLRLILKTDANDATVNNDLGYMMADRGVHLEEAEKLIRKAIELDQQPGAEGKSILGEENRPNAAYIDSLGWVLFRRGRLAEARRELENAVALPEGASDPVVWDHLGDVYFRLGTLEQARTAWTKAVSLYEVKKRRKLDDTYQELKHKLQLLESEAHQRGEAGPR